MESVLIPPGPGNKCFKNNDLTYAKVINHSITNGLNMAKRSIEQTLGLAGGIIAIAIGALSDLVANIGQTLHLGGSGLLSGAEIGILFGLIGLFGAFIVTSKKHDGGLIMLVIGIAGIIALANGIYLIPFVLLIVAGIIARA